VTLKPLRGQRSEKACKGSRNQRTKSNNWECGKSVPYY